MKNLRLIFLLLLIALFADRAVAVSVLNGSFEYSFAGWQTIGNVANSAPVGVPGPTNGHYQAFLSADSSAATAAELEAFMGLPNGELSKWFRFDAAFGSAIKTTISKPSNRVYDIFQYTMSVNYPSLSDARAFVAYRGGAGWSRLYINPFVTDVWRFPRRFNLQVRDDETEVIFGVVQADIPGATMAVFDDLRHNALALVPLPTPAGLGLSALFCLAGARLGKRKLG